ncbi:conserved hypothetical protein [Microsporum canis CBS 113480]|uniref:Uncharacterized protein n=1 Tax=Arthroderma otae (strain ATCC MYA-4605 / CBS 113480) TaxID=554155 RepID=C5FLA1_ARTOC|nr:conserved hypothetical protein [Microsporum canis CBS 113480]EEQ30473.1 conserved hypothetical protein [Microsporum canis CBS 113480]
MVKTESSISGIYDMEMNCYEFRCTRHSPYIRAIHEAVDNGTDKCMVFEWMDTNLWTLRTRAQELRQPFLKVTARSILEATKPELQHEMQAPLILRIDR